MKILKKALKFFACILLIPVLYLLISLLLTAITVNKDIVNSKSEESIFISTNGVHLDIIIPVKQIDFKLIEGLNINDANYLSFGWGDENFYLNTPTWGDLTFSNAFSAMFLKSNTLIHLTRCNQKRLNWIEVKINEKQLKTLNNYILNSFKLSHKGSKIILKGKGYSFNDDFYKANGSYSCFKTCNSWVNSALKESGLKSSYWTPFDFGVINKYK